MRSSSVPANVNARLNGSALSLSAPNSDVQSDRRFKKLGEYALQRLSRVVARDYSNSDFLTAALSSKDHKRFEFAILNISGTERRHIVSDNEFAPAVYQTVKELVAESEARDDLTSLLKAADIGTAALLSGCDFDRAPYHTSIRLVRALTYKNQGHAACLFTEAALRSGYRIPQPMIMAAIVKAGKFARIQSHLLGYGELALRSARDGLLDFSAENTAKVYNVILGILGSHGPLGTRISRYKGNEDLIARASRLKLAGEIGLEVVKRGIDFSADESCQRINYLARALSSGAALLGCFGEYWDMTQTGRVSVSERRRLQQAYRVSRESLSLQRGRRFVNREEISEDADILLSYALELLDSSFEKNSATEPSKLVHEIKGATVNRFLECFAVASTDVCEYDCLKICSLVKKACEVPSVARHLYSFAISDACERLLTSRASTANDCVAQICAASVSAGVIPSRCLVEFSAEFLAEELQFVSNQFEHYEEVRRDEKAELLEALGRQCEARILLAHGPATFDKKEALKLADHNVKRSYQDYNQVSSNMQMLQDRVLELERGHHILESCLFEEREIAMRKLPYFGKELLGGLGSHTDRKRLIKDDQLQLANQSLGRRSAS